MHLRTRAPRGNALMLTLIAIAVLMVLVVGAIQFTHHNREATAEKLRGERVGACADAARRHLLSRLKLFQATSDLQILNTRLIDDPDPNARSQMMTGHYGSAPESTVVEVSPVHMGQASRQALDISNRMSGTLGGKYFRVVVKCLESAGRESEVEFLFRYGL